MRWDNTETKQANEFYRLIWENSLFSNRFIHQGHGGSVADKSRTLGHERQNMYLVSASTCGVTMIIDMTLCGKKWGVPRACLHHYVENKPAYICRMSDLFINAKLHTVFELELPNSSYYRASRTMGVSWHPRCSRVVSSLDTTPRRISGKEDGCLWE